MRILKVGVLDVWSKLCPSWRSCELWFIFCLYGAVLGMGFMVRLCIGIYYLFQGGYFLIHLIHRNHSATFWMFFRGHCSMFHCSIQCVCSRKEVPASPVSPSWSVLLSAYTVKCIYSLFISFLQGSYNSYQFTVEEISWSNFFNLWLKCANLILRNVISNP